MVNYSSDTLDATFAALADPTRRAILAELARGESLPSVLARPFQMSLPAISKHLRVLEDAGLVVRRREGRRIACALRPQPLADAVQWLEQHRTFWEDRLDALAKFLDQSRKEQSSWQRRPRRPPSPSASRARTTTRRKRSSGHGPTRRR